MSYSLESKDSVIKQLNSSYQGLSSEEANRRLSIYGLNELKNKKNNLILKLILNQISNFLVIILIIAALISYLIGNIKDFILIIAIVILNLILGFFQEYKSEKAIESLKKLSSLSSRVIRDNHIVEIETKYLVPGDIILFEEGSKIPADGRIIECNNLETQESSLTGESTPVEKNSDKMENISSIGDQKNIVFSSTIVTKGTGKSIIISTGMNTEIGKIAKLIEIEQKSLTPIQVKLNSLSKNIGLWALIICFGIMISIFYVNKNIEQALFIGLSLIVAAIPEGLPAVVTICLAIGIQKMSKKKVIIRRLAAAETLGSTNMIITDKTGTLTKNEMTVKKIFINDTIVEVSGSGYNDKGSFYYNNISLKKEDLDFLLKIGVLCNNSSLDLKKETIVGDPTEASLLVSASKSFIYKEDLERIYVRKKEIPFNSKNKFMATIYGYEGKDILFVKGAPDILLNYCSYILKDGKKIRIDAKTKNQINKINRDFSNESLRVLGFAYKDSKIDEINDLIFVGLQGMIDPPKEEVSEYIQKCYDAGIKIKMVTGDFIGTANAIAKKIGIKGKSIIGEEIEKLDDLSLSKIIDEYDIYARVSPEHKLRIVKILQKKNYTVAVTGDGINDAPALKKADIGISMGIHGTDVSKESSDMILLNDNFNSIVDAIEEGRTIYTNIQKFVAYMLAINIAELIIIIMAIFLNWELPLLATQILFINLIINGVPALALSVDPAIKDIMRRKPINSKKSIINKELFTYIFFINLIITFTILVIFKSYLDFSGIDKARTMAFTLVIVSGLISVYLIKSIFDKKLRNNFYLDLSVLISLIIHLSILYTPLKTFFGVVSLTIQDWQIIALGCLIIIVLFVIMKNIINYIKKSNLIDSNESLK